MRGQGVLGGFAMLQGFGIVVSSGHGVEIGGFLWFFPPQTIPGFLTETTQTPKQHPRDKFDPKGELSLNPGHSFPPAPLGSAQSCLGLSRPGK